MARWSPTARQRELIAELTHLRKDAGLSRKQVGDAVGAGETTVFRYERGETRPKPADVRLMAEVYGVTDAARISELVDMARDARKRPWWHRYRRTLKPGFDHYIGLEAAAVTVRTYEPQAVPGLLQTHDYARAITESASLDPDHDELDEKVKVRLIRQDGLSEQEDPLHLVAILDEAVLHRQVGGPETMRHQLVHLVETAQRHNITVHVLPFAAGGHVGMDGKFNILTFPDSDDPGVIYLEQAGSGRTFEDPEDVATYHRRFDALLAKALPTEKSVAFIAAIARNPAKR